LWDEADTAVEVWIEKEALAGVLRRVTVEWDVPLMPIRGYSSLTAQHDAAERIVERAEHGQGTAVYYFGDYDPSGEDIERAAKVGVGHCIAQLIDDRHDLDPEDSLAI
jgi:hypothetical protein